jgi:uncharacterized protein with PQ loop repeat
VVPFMFSLPQFSVVATQRTKSSINHLNRCRHAYDLVAWLAFGLLTQLNTFEPSSSFYPMLVTHIVGFIGLQIMGNMMPSEHVAENSGLVKCCAKSMGTKFLSSGKWPTWRTISSIICLFEFSTYFEQIYAHPQEDNCINTTSGIITLC